MFVYRRVLKIAIFERRYIFQTIIFGFYVSSQEGTSDVCYVQDIEDSTIPCTVSNLQSIPTVACK